MMHTTVTIGGRLVCTHCRCTYPWWGKGCTSLADFLREAGDEQR